MTIVVAQSLWLFAFVPVSLSLSLSFCLVCKCMLAQFLSLAPFMPGCPEELQADFVLYTGDFSRHHMEQLGGVVRASRQMCL